MGSGGLVPEIAFQTSSTDEGCIADRVESWELASDLEEGSGLDNTSVGHDHDLILRKNF